jgi:hypothetical protein
VERKFSQQEFERILTVSLQANEDRQKVIAADEEVDEEDDGFFTDAELFEAAQEVGIPAELVEESIRIVALEEKAEEETKHIRTMRDHFFAFCLGSTITGFLSLLIFFGVFPAKLPKYILPNRDDALVAFVFCEGIALFCGIGVFFCSADIKAVKTEAKMASQEEV